MLTNVLFVTVRVICLVLMSIKFSDLNSDPTNDKPLNMFIRLLLDLPTLILISVFSAFAYYLSRLNLEVETILHQIDDANHPQFNSMAPQSQSVIVQNQASEQYLQLYGDQIRENTTGFSKMFFIIANIILFIFYIVCFAKCKSIYCLISFLTL